MVQVKAAFIHERYVWLDQARGIIALLFIISALTWAHRGDLLLGVPLLGPTYLDHGYNYYNGSPPMITLIDVGQSIFLFFVGLTGYIAFSSRLRKRGAKGALVYGLQRVLMLYVLSVMGELIGDASGEAGLNIGLLMEKFDWQMVFLKDIMAVIAAGAAATYLAVYFVPNADRRAWIAIGIFAVHALAYAAYVVDRHSSVDDVLGLPQLPIGTIALAGLSILGSCFGQWLRYDPEDVLVGMRKRIVPVTGYCLLVSYCLEWIQHSDPHDDTAALMLLAAGLSGLLLVFMYGLNSIGIELPILTPLGKNLLLVFIIGAIGFDFYFELIPDWLIYGYPFGALLFIGFLPLYALVLLTRFLDRHNIIIRV